MLVYDITNEKSFENIKNWIRNIEEVSQRSVVAPGLGPRASLCVCTPSRSDEFCHCAVSVPIDEEAGSIIYGCFIFYKQDNATQRPGFHCQSMGSLLCYVQYN